MKNRTIIVQRLEQLDATLTNLQRIVNTQEPVQTYKEGIDRSKSLLEDIKSFIEREPKSVYEN
jgi:hypothetical protein